MRILILGVDGMLGANMAKWLLANTPHEIMGVDNGSGYVFYHSYSHFGERFQYRLEDMRSPNMDVIFSGFAPHICLCFSAYAAEGRANHIRKFIHDNNTVGTANIINCCINHNCKLIFSSSVAVYSGLPPFTEETVPLPIDEYGLSKYTSEKSIEIAGKESGLEWVIIRPRNLYGEWQNLFDPARNLMGILFYRMLNELPLIIFGDGSNRRNFTYIQDIMQPLYNSIRFDKQIFNLGAKQSYSIKEAVEIFCEVTGYKNVIHVEPRHEVPAAICATDKSEQLLDYKDKTSLYEGIKKMYDWAKQIKMQPLQSPPTLEITKNAHISLL